MDAWRTTLPIPPNNVEMVVQSTELLSEEYNLADLKRYNSVLQTRMNTVEVRGEQDH